MNYFLVFKPQSLKDLKKINKNEQEKILNKLEELSQNLQGDVKRLTNFSFSYRLRVGNYRVLFEIEKKEIIVYRIKHRKNSYKNN